jgi:phosphoribosylformimino-5-aminoimidazole carboxamide ribotide isomerase
MASSFSLLPALDLVDGRVVRLEQGDFGRQTTYRDDPVVLAGEFVASGARWLHIVDLDGARTGGPRQLAIGRAIAQAVGDRASIEMAGGLRSVASIEAALEAGASRVVLGTAAIRDPAFVGRAIDAHGPDRIVVALDVRAGVVVGEGWRADAQSREVDEAIAILAAAGVTTFEVTAIERDGLRTGPDFDLLRSMLARGREIIASGGVGGVADVLALRDIGCAGVILGRALYEGDFTVPELVEALG